MIDPELKAYLESIKKSAEKMEKKTAGAWQTFFRGILSGMGYVIGIALILVIIGWILNAMGVIPYFRDQIDSLKQTLEDVKRIR